MLKLISKKNHENYWDDQEVIDTPPTELIEENVYVDENSIKNKSLIRIDLNLIQFPIFSKNTHRKVNQIVKYYFNQNRDNHITVIPQAGDYIPGEMEEKVFIALMQLMKEKGMARKVIISSLDLKEKIKMSTIRYNDIISKSLSRLASTNYIFKNTLYSSEYKGIIGDKIETSIFNIRTITLSKKENNKYREMINDKRIKTLYEIEFSEHFYNNIIQKGYMVYDGNTLLEIESSTARTIYMLIEKLRFDNLYLKVDTIFLIKRIPLKNDKRNLSQTINTLKKAFEELVDKELILSFNFIKEKTWNKSEIEINFCEESKELKQKRFYEDRNDFRKMLAIADVSEMEHQMIEEVEVIQDKKNEIKITAEIIEKILNLMPKKAKELKTMPKAIKEAIESYGYEKVEKTAIYMKKNKVEKVRAYFLKALENDWVEDDEIIPPKLDRIATKEPQLDFGTNIPQYDESLYIEFEKLSIEVQNGIETYAYRDYIKKCGIETKIQQLAFMGSRKKYICEYLERYPEILGKKKEIKEKESESPIEPGEKLLTNTAEIRQIILDIVDMSKLLKAYADGEETKLIKIIIAEVSIYIKNRNLTKNKLDEILNKHTGI